MLCDIEDSVADVPVTVVAAHNTVFKKNDTVEVDFNGVWWEATILACRRGRKYLVQYKDDENNVEDNVPSTRIRYTTK